MDISRKGVTAVEQFYASLSNRLGYEILSEENAVNTAAYELFDVLGDSALAKELFELNVRTYPESPNGHAGLARIAERQGDFSGAVRHIERALALVDRSDIRYGRFADQLSGFQNAADKERELPR